ncbi:MFS transporter [Plantibacter sp. YIM 135249]|uniref:MFS transporter n=1 Tax=Plantibacter sp. YIM 135249 TaxID=3423918 RepID=UPI003D35779E
MERTPGSIPARTKIPAGTMARYAIGSIGTGGFATLPGLVLVYYLTDTLGVSALLAGLVVTIAKIWDVLIDPVIGARSDRSLAHTGSRRRFMLMGAIALPVFFVLTFLVPVGTPAIAAAIWVMVAFVLCATAFSLFQVPYIALPAELVQDYDARTRLLTWRVVVLTFAILLFGAGGPILRSAGSDAHQGYAIMAVVAGAVIGGGMIISATVAPKGAPTSPSDMQPTKAGIADHYRTGIAVLRRSQPFRALLLTFLLQGLATGVMLATANYVATWVLHSEDAVTLLFLALIAPAFVFAPVWGAVARRIGKERGFFIASTVFAVAALSLTGLLWAPGPWLYVSVAVAGACYAGMQSLPMAMLPDVITHDAATHGTGSAGSFGGVWTAGETTGMALGATLLTVVLALTGYLVRTAGVDVVQPPEAVSGIVLSFSVLPAALVLISLVSLSRYRLRKDDIDVRTPTV